MNQETKIQKLESTILQLERKIADQNETIEHLEGLGR